MRRPVQFFADIIVLCTAFMMAYMPAFNIRMEDFYAEGALAQLPFVVFIQFSSLFLVGAYSILWRYVSIQDVNTFLKAAVISAFILLVLRFLLEYSDFKIWQVPISVILIDTVLAFGGLMAVRVMRRFVYELSDKPSGPLGKRRPVKRRPTLLVGAGRMGATLAKEIRGHADGDLEIYGLVDDDPQKKGGSVGGYRVLGTTHDLPRLVEEMNIESVVITIDHAQGGDIRRILNVCSELPVSTQIVPSLNEIAHGRVSVSRIRDVQIEDLLGREPVRLDDQNLHELLSGKRVMVTGAGGSIGSELVRQIANYRPEQLLLAERSEFFLFQISREMEAAAVGSTALPLLADVNDESRMREIFEKYRPQIIFHAAAHKHVHLMENNSAEAVKNNIFATRQIGRMAGEYGAEAFVLISTDKAVNPTSVMGASKRVAEIVVQGLNQLYDTKYMAVRFGNVLGSAGSVVPIFREQIEKGQPITVTDPKMTRYFMTIPEASQLVLQAGALGTGGEIFILDMGTPVRILDLAEDMIRLSGLTPYEDIDIIFTGARKGEKLFEELEITGEDLLKTLNPKIYIGRIAAYSNEQVAAMISEFAAGVEKADETLIRMTFNRILPEAAVTVDGTHGELPSDMAESGKYAAAPAKLASAEK